jgi:hypothetical protein
MWTYIDEDALGLTTSSAGSLRDCLADVPLVEGLVLAAAITARVRAARYDVDAHLALARELCGGAPIFARITKFVGEHERPVVFAEQNCMILQRLLIEAAADAPPGQPRTDDNNLAIVRALFGASSIAGQASERAEADLKTPEDFLALFIQNGAYNSTRNPIGEIARAQELFERLARRADLQVPGCPVDEWMAEDYGLDIAEQFNLGFAVSAITHAWHDDPRSKLYVSPENFDDLLLKLGLLDRRHQALELISATREQFQAEFAAAGTSVEHLAWETRPFMRHPCLRTSDDGLVLTSAKAMQSWLTDGFYYRLLTSAQRRSVNDGGRTSNLFTSLAGSLLEAYELEVMRSVLPGARPLGAGRVRGEQPYGRGDGKRTSDVAVDLGQDLVLFEVSNSRLRADTLILGDNERVKADLDRMISKKIKQLDGCIEALLAGEATIPGVDISDVLRIWPVIVTAGEITQTDELWTFIDRESGGRLDQPKVQPLTLLDVEDYDQLCALIEDGHSLYHLLDRKLQPAFRRRELAVWLDHDPGAPGQTQPPNMVKATFDRTTARLLDTADFTRGIQARSSRPRLPSPTAPSSSQVPVSGRCDSRSYTIRRSEDF